MRHDHGTHRRCCFLPISMVLVFSVVVLVALLTPASAQTLGAPFPGLLPPPGVSTAPSVYSALLDFQAGWVTGENPYGVWSYGGSWGLTGPLVLFQEHWTDSDYEMLQQWAEPSVFGGESEDAGVPHVSRNWSYDYDDGNASWAAGRLSLHHGPNDAYSHLIFTAPSGGLYSVVATRSSTTSILTCMCSSEGGPISATHLSAWARRTALRSSFSSELVRPSTSRLGRTEILSCTPGTRGWRPS